MADSENIFIYLEMNMLVQRNKSIPYHKFKFYG